MAEAPDIREQEDCPSGEVCEWACDQHERRPMWTPEKARADVERAVQLLRESALVYVKVSGGTAPLGEVLDHLQAIDRRDDLVSRAFSSVLTGGQLNLDAERNVIHIAKEDR